VSQPSQGLSPERLVELYAQMVRIREFEERVKRTFTDHPGVIRGHTHLADGAEASIVGSVAAIGEGDAIVATYRCHGYPIALGSDTAAMMAEIYGRSTGICKGYGGSMHLADPARGFLGTSGIVGQNIPQGTGAAYAAQLRGRGEVSLTFFGDGASKQGAFHESLNIAAVWKLPAVFIMENNSFSATVRTEQEDANAAAGEPLSMKAKAYSIPGVTIDGSDVLAVHEAVSEAVARARAGDGPTLIESRVYRLSAHGNSIAPPGVPLHYPEHEAISKYGAVEEYEAAKRGDPIPRLRAHLVETGVLTAERAAEIIEAAQAEMQRAVDFALESPYPEPHEALAYVYA
jgi:TPP-dependent pyruvate/acetoin dehydrogenase alpha subunit